MSPKARQGHTKTEHKLEEIRMTKANNNPEARAKVTFVLNLLRKVKCENFAVPDQREFQRYIRPVKP